MRATSGAAAFGQAGLMDRWRSPIALAASPSPSLRSSPPSGFRSRTAPKIAADAYTYLAAGERLNAGHHLYELRPGDRWIWINPPFWTVPLLSPPLIGVLWRPLAAIPNDGGLLLWQVLTIGTIGATVVALIVRLPIRASLLAIALAVPIGFEMDVANVNGLLLGGYVLSWWLFARHRSVVGFVVAAMALVKIAPVVLAWWLFTQRRWRAVAWFAGGSLLLLMVGILGSSLEMHLRYLSIATQTVSGGNSNLSLAGVASGARRPTADRGPIAETGARCGRDIDLAASKAARRGVRRRDRDRDLRLTRRQLQHAGTPDGHPCAARLAHPRTHVRAARGRSCGSAPQHGRCVTGGTIGGLLACTGVPD